MTAPVKSTLLCAALLGALLGGGCSVDSRDVMVRDGGGGSGSGGTSGSGSGGTGSGGSSGSGGTGSGGINGSGGGSGDAGTGGRGDDVGGDRPDVPATDGPAPDSPAGGPTLDACFAGLRAGDGDYQIGTKASSDGRFRVRLALETGGRIGTSGTKPWGAYRFGIETPDGNVCVTDQAALTPAYKVSHHNCADTFELTAGGRRFVITAPDTDPARAASRLTIFMGATQVAGPVDLASTTCTARVGACRSGGPC